MPSYLKSEFIGNRPETVKEFTIRLRNANTKQKLNRQSLEEGVLSPKTLGPLLSKLVVTQNQALSQTVPVPSFNTTLAVNSLAQDIAKLKEENAKMKSMLENRGGDNVRPQNSKRNIECYYCKKFGHFQSECRSKLGGNQRGGFPRGRGGYQGIRHDRSGSE